MKHSVQKSTYVESDERTTKALTYDMLYSLHLKLDQINTCYNNHLGLCNERFKALEVKRVKDTTVAAMSGVGGGFLAMAAYYLKQWLS